MNTHLKQEFVDHVSKFIVIVDKVKERLVNVNKMVNLKTGKERENLLFWLNCIEDGSNSIAMSLRDHDTSDLIKGISYILYELYFGRGI